MTTKERTAIQSFINEFSQHSKRSTEVFRDLQQLSKKNNLPMWGNATMNRDQLQNTKDALKADMLLEEYNKLQYFMERDRQLGSVLCKLGFWKQQG